MNLELDADEAPDAFTTDGQCWAWRKVRVPIGCASHTHTCRDETNEPGHHDGPHHCSTCGEAFQ